MVILGILQTARKVLGRGEGEQTPSDEEEVSFNTLVTMDGCEHCEDMKNEFQTLIKAGAIEVIDSEDERLKEYYDMLDEKGFPLLAEVEKNPDGSIRRLEIKY